MINDSMRYWTTSLPLPCLSVHRLHRELCETPRSRARYFRRDWGRRKARVSTNGGPDLRECVSSAQWKEGEMRQWVGFGGDLRCDRAGEAIALSSPARRPSSDYPGPKLPFRRANEPARHTGERARRCESVRPGRARSPTRFVWARRVGGYVTVCVTRDGCPCPLPRRYARLALA